MDEAPQAPGNTSLIGRISGVRLRFVADGWRIAAAVALLGTAGPLLTIAGAQLLTARERTELLRLERDPRVVAARAADDRQSAIRELLARPALSSTLDQIARTLPTAAALTSAEIDANGTLRIEVAAPDPDQLRAALRRDPAKAALRDIGQRRGEGVMLITLERGR